MSKVVEKEAELTAAPVATTEETKEQPKLSEEPKTQVDSIDYKAKLAKAESKIVDLKREKKVAPLAETGDIAQQLKAMEERLTTQLDEKTSGIERRSKEDKYSDAISAISSNDDEASLIKHILDNDIKPSGDIAKDVRRAKLLANEDNITSENLELKQALATRKTIGGISTGGQRVTEDKKTWTALDRKFAKAAGLDLNNVGKRK